MTQGAELPSTKDYLDRMTKQSLGGDRTLVYDRDVAQALGITPAAVSLYRKGGNMNALVAVKVAIWLHLHPMETISATMAHQAKTADDKAFWIACYHTYRGKPP